jgi:hypothetical protein
MFPHPYPMLSRFLHLMSHTPKTLDTSPVQHHPQGSAATTFGNVPAASPAMALLMNHGLNYPTPVNLSYFWNFGSLSALCLGLQLLSGIFLAMHYTAALSLAFDSVEHIMRDVSGGWFIRYRQRRCCPLWAGALPPRAWETAPAKSPP